MIKVGEAARVASPTNDGYKRRRFGSLYRCTSLGLMSLEARSTYRYPLEEWRHSRSVARSDDAEIREEANDKINRTMPLWRYRIRS
jgi:hypothetical protein